MCSRCDAPHVSLFPLTLVVACIDKGCAECTNVSRSEIVHLDAKSIKRATNLLTPAVHALRVDRVKGFNFDMLRPLHGLVKLSCTLL
jgi:hypothetical protein